MASFTLKNIPDELYSRLKRSATAHRRSINSEALVCLERALVDQRTDPEPLLRRVDAVRERVRGPQLTDRALRTARNTGRP